MAEMIETIKQIDDWELLEPQAIADALGEYVVKPDSFQTFNSLVIALDQNVALVEQLIGAMRAAGLNASADSLTNRGIDFGLASVPVMLDLLASAAPQLFTAEVVNTLNRLGQQTRWESLGGVGDVPAPEQVTAAIAADSLATTKRQLEDAAKDRLQAYREALSAWDGSGEGPVL